MTIFFVFYKFALHSNLLLPPCLSAVPASLILPKNPG